MYIHSVKLINFKSIGDYPEAEIILEPKVTAIIGKNESGKSNVLNGLSRIRFRERNNTIAFSADIVNRSCVDGQENKYIVILKPTNDDKAIGIVEDTKIIITKNSYEAKGGILTYFLQTVQPDVDSIIETLGPIETNPMQLRDQDWTNYQIYYNELIEKGKIDIPRRTMALDFLKSRVGKIAREKQEVLKSSIDKAKEKLLQILDLLPSFFYRKTDKHLNTSYKLEDIERELKNPTTASNSLLSDFVKLIGVSQEDFVLASRSGSSAKQETLRRRINKLVEEKINKPFHDFYLTETITLDLGFNAGVVSFVVQSGEGEALLLSERSNGLRWYLETFIDAQANDISGRNVVYLLDEPGTSLHVNAQRELLKLFHHLAEKGNQVVYTTHSPYMLDLENDGIHRIRAVAKNAEGFTFIYKTAYDARIAPDSQQDTLAPIISAIGMNLNDTFGPAKDKINIVTEGMSDYIYFCLMAKVLGIDTDKYAIIPSVGAPNCINVCSILHGWGCRYIAIFDYDEAGVRTGGEYLRKEMMFEYRHQYCYLADVSQEEVDKKTYKTATYMIEDVVTRKEIDRFCTETNTSRTIGKPLMAKLMNNAIESGAYQLGEECKLNFEALFNRIFSYFEE